MILARSPREQLSYKGLQIGAAANLHTLAANAISTLQLPINSRILDLGAGAGAFCARLRDLGFTRIDAGEIEPKKFAVPEIVCRRVDLNVSDFSKDLEGEYDLISALEVVEHLENAWCFFRNVGLRLRTGGYLLVSSPNVTSAYSRLRFLRDGELHWFGPDRLRADGHMSPLFEWQVNAMAERAGMDVVDRYHTDDRMLRAKYVYPRGRIRAMFSRWFYLYHVARAMMRGPIAGELQLWILQRHGR